jgi:hypothetical protein
MTLCGSLFLVGDLVGFINLIRQNVRCAHIPWVNLVKTILTYSITSTKGIAVADYNRRDRAGIGVVDAAWRQPIRKPKTRGNCVVLLDVEVKDYYY